MMSKIKTILMSCIKPRIFSLLICLKISQFEGIDTLFLISDVSYRENYLVK